MPPRIRFTGLSPHAVFLCSVISLQADEPRYRVVDIVAGAPSNTSRSFGQDINDAGQVAGMLEFDFFNGRHQAFLYDDTAGLRLLPVPAGAGHTQGLGLNNYGVVVGVYSPMFGGSAQAIQWGKIGFTILLPLEANALGVAQSINDAGVAVGTSARTNPDLTASSRAAHWAGGYVTDLGTLGTGSIAFAYVINNEDQIIGLSSTEPGPNAPGSPFIISGGAMTPIATGGLVEDINDRGEVVGGLGDHAMLFTPSPIDLGTLPGDVASHAYGINNLGQIVGRSLSATPSLSRAFLWENGVMYNLNELAGLGPNPFPGLKIAWDINDAGQIVGYSGDPSNVGIERAYRLDPVVTIQVVDPNPELLSGSAVTTDITRLGSSAGRAVRGVAADGVTPIVLRIRVPQMGLVSLSIEDENGATAGIGTLSTPGGAPQGSALTLPVISLGQNRYAALAVLTAPVDFVRGPADEPLGRRKIKIGAEFTPTGSKDAIAATREIELTRPPVMLIHGLWSSRDTWRWPLMNDSRFTVYVQDYRSSNAAPIPSNVVRARQGVAAAVRKLRDKGFAVTQADVFGHSMGGLLTRLYIAASSGEYLRNDTFGRGDVHKFVTVDAPHAGSPLASRLANPDGTSTWLGWLFTNALKKCADCGAVRDLRPDSAVITTLPLASVPAHAIVGKGGSDITQAGLEATLPRPMQSALTVLRFFGLLPEDVFPAGLQHDLIVGRLSQEGGLGTGSTRTSVFGFLDGTHVTVTNRDAAGLRAVQLLNASISDTSTFATGFPAAPLRSVPVAAFDFPEFTLAVGGGITITSPPPGAVVTPNGQLAVTVEPFGGFVPDRVVILGDEDAEIVESAPYVATLDISSNAIGLVEVTAFALDDQDNLALAVPLPVSVDVSANLTGISIQPETLYAHAYAPATELSVTGHYDDGADRDITAAALGTTYSALDPQIASVDSNSVIAPHAVGSTAITAASGGFSATLEVVVATAFGDRDSDGVVNLLDFVAFAACFSGPIGGPEFDLPEILCRDIFDADRDLDVDLTDFDAFLAVYGGPLDDCNNNGTLDLRDILLGVSADCNPDGIADECQADCNTNGFPDACDLTQGLSPDCDSNGVPDECEPDCNTNGRADACDLSGGTSADCNANATPDECDIESGGSADCNTNGTPDECEPDCNLNGTADPCDITGGTSADCDLNLVPDDCDLAFGTGRDCNADLIPDACDVVAGTSLDCNANGTPDECDVTPPPIGVSASGPTLYRLDPTNAELTAIGDMDAGAEAADALAVHPLTGEVFAIVKIGSARSLAVVEPLSGVLTVKGDPGLSLADLAFGDDGTLYGMAANSSPSPGELFVVSTVDGSLTATGIVRGSGAGQSIAFRPGTSLIYHAYGTTSRGEGAFSRLETIDVVTGQVATLTTSLQAFEVTALTFKQGGMRLLGFASDALYDLDPETGEDTLIGYASAAIAGMGYLGDSPADCNHNALPDVCDNCADADGDGIPSQSDAAAFVGCLTGPSSPAGAACRCILDADADGDLDLGDYAAFQACFY